MPAKSGASLLLVKNDQSSEWSYFIHYLRNSLGTLGALADYYGDHPPSEQQVKKLLEQVKKLALQSKDYIAAFSEFTKPFDPVLRPVVMPEWFRDHVALHRVSSAPGIRFTLTLPQEPFLVAADPEQLARAVNAFLENALEAVPPDGELSVSLSAEDGYAVFRFRNAGQQLSPTVLPDLGKPFLTMKTGRLGMGLAWARRAADVHRGDFGGANVPGGVEFWMMIPVIPGGIP